MKFEILETHDPLPFVPTCNGGTYNPLNQTCSCPPYQSGTTCDVYTCQNGGSLNPFPLDNGPKCICPDGFSGYFCESCKSIFCFSSF